MLESRLSGDDGDDDDGNVDAVDEYTGWWGCSPLHAGIPRRRPPIIWQMDACSLSTPYTPYFSISVLSSPFTYIAGFHPSSQKESLQWALHFLILFHQFLSFSLVDSRRRNIVHICSFWAKLAYFLNESNFSSVSCLSVSNRHGVEVLDLVSASIKCLLGRLSGDQTHRFLATADAFLSSPRK